ncbi:MAG: deoxyribose-phosphate aldolase, partial [Propionibacteriaceae bacterium]|nr:deoxyribose-phosphate aldolase [Propionibacteriaceae bacterium]
MIDLAKMDKHSLGKCFDHSVLPKQTTEADIRSACQEAMDYNCAAFYTASPYWTPVVVEALAGSDVLPGTGIAFPFGVAPTAIKAAETELAVKLGCRTIDLVLNVGSLKDHRYDLVKQDLTAFKTAAGDALTKVILDTCFLSDDDIKAACELIAETGCDYAKTATGQFEGPTMDQFLVMKKTLAGTPVKLKVAGVKFPRPQNAY